MVLTLGGYCLSHAVTNLIVDKVKAECHVLIFVVVRLAFDQCSVVMSGSSCAAVDAKRAED